MHWDSSARLLICEPDDELVADKSNPPPGTIPPAASLEDNSPLDPDGRPPDNFYVAKNEAEDEKCGSDVLIQLHIRLDCHCSISERL